jgi:uncharacterized protein YbjT (DUF2867 family)
MARVLIVGCGCRGAGLGDELRARGHSVRASTRRPGRVAELDSRGFEVVLADPDRVATLAPALEHVGVLCLLLGGCVGSPAAVAALHGTRLEMILLRALDSTVRGIVYEAAGAAPGEVLAAGAERVRAFCGASRIPHRVLAADPGDVAAWQQAAVAAVEAVLA